MINYRHLKHELINFAYSLTINLSDINSVCHLYNKDIVFDKRRIFNTLKMQLNLPYFILNTILDKYLCAFSVI
jgi:hypothetical protein